MNFPAISPLSLIFLQVIKRHCLFCYLIITLSLNIVIAFLPTVSFSFPPHYLYLFYFEMFKFKISF